MLKNSAKTRLAKSFDVDRSVLGTHERIVLLDPIDGKLGLKMFGLDKRSRCGLDIARKTSGRCK